MGTISASRLSLAAVILVSSFLLGCATSPERETEEQQLEDERVQALFDDPLFDGVYVVPGVDFSHYDSLLVTDLDLSQWRPEGRELPLQGLNRNDQAFFRQEYSGAIVHYLVTRGGYQLSLDPGENVLRVDARLRQSVQQPLNASREAPRGSIVMLLTFELYDSVTGQMVGTMTHRQPIDRSFNQRNSPLTTAQVRRAFAQWTQWFKRELDELRD